MELFAKIVDDFQLLFLGKVPSWMWDYVPSMILISTSEGNDMESMVYRVPIRKLVSTALRKPSKPLSRHKIQFKTK